MKPRTFLFFVAPSLLLMFVFIALPLASVLVGSFQVSQQVFEEVKVETCTPGFLTQNCVEDVKTRPKLDENGRPLIETRWVGLDTYRVLLQSDAVMRAFSPGGGGLAAVLNIDFYKALRFTLTFTLLTLPLMLLFGMTLALAVNNITRAIRGPVIFVSLLPFIITPVIGALSIRWLFVGDGIMTAFMSWTLGHPVSLLSQG